MKKQMRVLAMVWMCGFYVWAGGDALVLEQVEGVAGACVVLRYDAEQKLVKLRGDDGLVSLPVSSLSDSDRKKVVGWATDQAFRSGLYVKIKDKSTKEVTDSRDMDGTAGRTSYTVREEETMTFTVDIKNKSEFELRDMEFDYQIFYERETTATDEEDLKEKWVTKGTKSISLASGENASFDVPLTLVSYVYSNPGFDMDYLTEIEDKLNGILVVSSYTASTGDTMVREFKDGRLPDKDERDQYMTGSASSITDGKKGERKKSKKQ